ncbi:hypothetical protein BGZ60DRAFT_205794 [Tricladium varicosporioides]|nr:hypothetical protein BGZ60DRAFT_205794 [Hymenoscyphus varicosporioides]
MEPKRTSSRVRDKGVVNGISKKSCTRCRYHKRKCDSTHPTCSRCTRLQTNCIYDNNLVTPSSSSASSTISAETPSVRPSIKFPEFDFKTLILEKLSSTPIEDVVGLHFRTIHLWFPILADANLCRRLPRNWENSVDEFTLLFAIMSLLNATPPNSNDTSGDILWEEIRELYLLCKSWFSILEAYGKNTLGLVQARVLLVLFETFHGVFPAAYISIAGAVRAIDALCVYAEINTPLLHSATVEEYEEDYRQTWRCILILDRFLALESHTYPSVTKNRVFHEKLLLGTPQPISIPLLSPNSFSDLFEASKLLDKVQSTDFLEQDINLLFNEKELAIVTQNRGSEQDIMVNDIPKDLKLYNSSWAINNISRLILYSFGINAPITQTESFSCMVLSQNYLSSLFADIFDVIHPYTFSPTSDLHETQLPIELNFQLLPPFLTQMLFKAASVFTERMRKGDFERNTVDGLRTLRKMLELLGCRWLCARRYLKLLSEDTTLRMMRALE